MIAVDTNILVHAHRADSPWHDAAAERLREVNASAWGIPWPCIHEFLAIVTHPRIFLPPTPAALWTADRDFSRFGGLRVRNPLVA